MCLGEAWWTEALSSTAVDHDDGACQYFDKEQVWDVAADGILMRMNNESTKTCLMPQREGITIRQSLIIDVLDTHLWCFRWRTANSSGLKGALSKYLQRLSGESRRHGTMDMEDRPNWNNGLASLKSPFFLKCTIWSDTFKWIPVESWQW